MKEAIVPINWVSIQTYNRVSQATPGQKLVVNYDFTDERGRKVGHVFRVWQETDGSFSVNQHILRNGETYGALMRDAHLEANSMEEAMAEVEARLGKVMQKTARAMAKRRGEKLEAPAEAVAPARWADFQDSVAEVAAESKEDKHMAKQTTQVETKPQSVAARLGLERLPKMTRAACSKRAKTLTARIEAGEFNDDAELLAKAKTWAGYYRRQSQIVKAAKPKVVSTKEDLHAEAEDAAATVLAKQAPSPVPKPSKKKAAKA